MDGKNGEQARVGNGEGPCVAGDGAWRMCRYEQCSP